MQFRDIVGQEPIKKKLLSTVNEGRVSHAQLFLGPEGSGKLALALAYAQYISCLNKSEDDSCGVCSSCIKYKKLIHPDLHFFFPYIAIKKENKTDTKSYMSEWRSFVLQNNAHVSLDAWLNFINIENKQAIISVSDSSDIVKTLTLKSFESAFKIIIIFMVETLHHLAAPKLLKSLEEPPPNTLFILISENHDQILKTILSRTQLVKIPKYNDDETLNFLTTQHNIESQDAFTIARIADGNLCEARRLTANLEEAAFYLTNFRKWMQLCYTNDIAGIIAWSDEMSKTANVGREKLKRFLNYALKTYRNCLLLKYSDTEPFVKLSLVESEFVKKFSLFITPQNLPLLNDEFTNAIYHVERNANPRLLLLDMSFKLMKLIKKV